MSRGRYCARCLDRWSWGAPHGDLRLIHPRCWVALVRAALS